MTKNLKQNDINEINLYNKILSFSRNKFFYTKVMLSDTFQNRIHLIFIHVSFVFIKINHDLNNKKYKDFYQRVFDLVFKKIEQNMREVGYGDVLVNKKMKLLVKSFYNILLYCENYKVKTLESKNFFFNNYLESVNNQKMANNEPLVEYFDRFQAFCFDLSSDSVLQGELNFKYK